MARYTGSRAKDLAWGKELVEYRARFTVDAIRKALGETGH
jgi:hypothetical protein